MPPTFTNDRAAEGVSTGARAWLPRFLATDCQWMSKLGTLLIGCILVLAGSGLAAHFVIQRRYGSRSGLLHMFADRELFAWLILAGGVLGAVVLLTWYFRSLRR